MALPDDVQVVSVDDHVIEHPNVWQDRLAAKYKDAGPKIVRDDEGRDVWMYEGRPHYNIGLNAVAGKRREDYGVDPDRLRQHAQGLLRAQGAPRRHGRRRDPGAAVLPDLPRLRGQHLLRRDRQGARRRVRERVQRLDDRRVVRGHARPPDPAHARCRTGTSTPPPRKRLGSRRRARRASPSPSFPMGSVSPRSTPTTGTRSSPSPRRRACRSASTSDPAARRASRRRRRSPPRSRCSASTRRCARSTS